MKGYLVQVWDDGRGWVDHAGPFDEIELAWRKILFRICCEYRIVNLDDPHASPLLVTIARER